MSHYFFPKISENTLHMYKLKVKKFQHASINHKKVIKKKPTGGGKFTPPPPDMHNRVNMITQVISQVYTMLCTKFTHVAHQGLSFNYIPY